MSYRYRFFPALSVGLLSLLTPFALAADCTTARLAVYFSPSGGATDAVVREVNDAKKQILVQAYSFTSAPIAQALVDAPKRGVKILAVTPSILLRGLMAPRSVPSHFPHSTGHSPWSACAFARYLCSGLFEG